MTAKQKSDDEIKNLIAAELRQAINYDNSENASRREKAINFFHGDLAEYVPVKKGRSSVTSKDTSDTIGWMKPSIMRTFMASGRFCDYEANTQDYEQFAEQAGDYHHNEFMKENDGYGILSDATDDCLLHGDAIVKTYWDDSEQFDTTIHSGLTEEQLTLIMQDKSVEILASSIDDETGLIDAKIKRIKSKGRLVFDVVERENFGINEQADTIDEARITYHRREMTRSDLIEMGFKKEKIKELASDMVPDWHLEEHAREQDRQTGLQDSTNDKSMQLIEVYECYLKTDVDGDGVAEMIRAYYAGNYAGGKLLEWEIWEDDNPFTAIQCYPVAHRFESNSVSDETMDIQVIQTTLWRQMLDNMYAHNNPRPEVEKGSVINSESLTAPKFGQPILKKQGSAPINWQTTPFIGDKALMAMEYSSSVIEKRTGVSRSTMALDPEALQNQTATAVQAGKDSSYSKIELIARNMAEGWKKVFEKALKITVRHQDRAKTIKIRGNWTEIDPTCFDPEMKVEINVGLGTGSRDRDMAMLNNVALTQRELMQGFLGMGLKGPALEMFPKIIKTFTKIGESAGIRNADDYYPATDEQSMQKIMAEVQQMSQQPSPEQMKMQAEMQMKDKELQMQIQMKQMDAQVQANKERAQAEADVLVDEKRLQSNMMIEEQKLNYQTQSDLTDAQLKEMEIQSKREIDLAEIETKIKIEMAKLSAQNSGDENVSNGNESAMLAELLQTIQAQMVAPRRLIKDENGDIIGAETIL